ncbi:MAG: DNA replication/repair protein RecF [Deltaproteobacteria bacterium]|nr:DNA replication/repair protein RecF [Deltaproteobacteria bacterium]
MRLESLAVENFRNLAAQEVRFSPGVNAIVGKNGQGKTSVLEAIYLLAQNRSFRPGMLADLLSWKHPELAARVAAEISSADGNRRVSYEIAGGRRRVRINDKPVDNSRGFYGSVRAVEFTPEDLSLVRSEPAARRAFIDRILAMVDPGFVESVVSYERALKNRNSLLRSQREARLPARELTIQLESLEKLLIEYGRPTVAARARFIREFTPAVIDIYARLAAHRESLSFRYQSELLDGDRLKELEELRADYAAERGHDIARGRTHLGPHRDDLVIELDTGSGAKGARVSASQGQTRSIALALKMGAVGFLEQATGEPPIVLLDDVESELDSVRRGALIELIQAEKHQVILTTIDNSSLVAHLGGRCDLKPIEEGLLRSTEAPL